MRLIVAFLVLVFSAGLCQAWSEGGHHLIAVMAYHQLSQQQQIELEGLLKSHPRYMEDFQPSPIITDIADWRVGRAGYWPDVARKSSFDRPDWHWQLGPTMVLGNPAGVPKIPGPLPEGATLDTKDLHIAQAVALCRRILNNQDNLAADRALALCWLAHLVADSHQPCHAGSLYTEKLFPQGDRRANSIPTKQRNNLHALWDSLLGPSHDAGDIRRRSREISADVDLWDAAKQAAEAKRGLEPLTWLAESAEYGKTHVYTGEVLAAVKAAEQDSGKIETVDLSEKYLKAAGDLAKRRAAFAAVRLALILEKDLDGREE